MTVPIPSDLMRQLNLTTSQDGRYQIVIPEKANIAADTVGRHATGPNAGKPALVYEDEGGAVHSQTYVALDAAASRCAAGLRTLGVERGDPVAVHLGQRPEAAIAHLAVVASLAEGSETILVFGAL